MKKQELSNLMGENQYMLIHFNCYDCGQEGTIIATRTSPTEINITGGALFQVPLDWKTDKQLLFKCEECFEKDNNFCPKIEVYSRVVGYLRPVKQWNGAKQSEYNMRTEFRPEI